MPSPVDNLYNTYKDLSSSDQQAFLKRVSTRKKPGPDALPQAPVHQAAKAILEEMTTIDGMPFDEWLMNMAPKDLEELPLDTWKETTQGWAVFKRKGRKKFEAWAKDQTEKLKEWKGLSMRKLRNLVESRLGLTPTRKTPTKGGEFAKWVREAKDEYLMGACFTWRQIPPVLRDGRQPGIKNDLAAFYQRQHDYINRT